MDETNFQAMNKVISFSSGGQVKHLDSYQREVDKGQLKGKLTAVASFKA